MKPEDTDARKATILFFCFIHFMCKAQYFVDPQKGNDRHVGTLTAPFRTIGRARDVVRTLIPSARQDITVFLRGGEYPIQETIVFTDADGGRPGNKIIYQAYENEKPVLEAGTKLYLKWHPMPNGILKAEGLNTGYFRQLYVNGRRADRARSAGKYRGSGWPRPYQSFVEENWELKKQYYPDGIKLSKQAVQPGWKNPRDIELVWIGEESNCTWRSHRLLVNNLQTTDNGDSVVVRLDNYGFVLTGADMSRPLPENPFYIENALELLDSPGEWYFDQHDQALYYYPRPGEDLHSAEIYIPGQIETVLSVKGRSLSQKVKNIIFKGIVFQHTAWIRPNSSRLGACSVQADKYISGHGQIGRAHKAIHRRESFFDPAYDYAVDANGEAEGFKPDACAELDAAEHIEFIDCEFQHLGAVGIDLTQGCNNIVMDGNRFEDLSATAIVIGRWDQDHIGAGEEVCKNVQIINNYIHQIGQEYYNSPGITAFYTDGMRIAHNEIADVPYSGISSGWGSWKGKTAWTTGNRRNLIEYNYIHDFGKKCSDGGGVYTVGIGKAPSDPDSLTSKIRFNYIQNANLSYGGLYPDEGSCFYDLIANVVENVGDRKQSKWLHLWSTYHHDIRVDGNFSNSTKFINKGINSPLTNQTTYEGENRPAAALLVIQQAGVEKSNLPENFAAATKNALVLKAIQFRQGENILTPAGIDELDRLGNWLTANPDVQIELSGHTSDEGDRQENLRLSERRAEACKKYLVARGISESRITTVGYGPLRPLDKRGGATGREKNRRVELRILN